MAKFATIFFTLVLLLSFSSIHASRPHRRVFPPHRGVSPPLNDESDETRTWMALEGGRGRDFVPHKDDDADERCEKAVLGTEECLMRRTLAAHTDYIYTQKHNPKP